MRNKPNNRVVGKHFFTQIFAKLGNRKGIRATSHGLGLQMLIIFFLQVAAGPRNSYFSNLISPL